MPWGTPENIPAGTVTKTLRVPDGELWDAIVTGGLYELTLAENFQEIGALTPEQVSERFLQMWEEYLMGLSIVGGIMMWPTNSAPLNWLICDGQAVDRVTYATLFALIGTTYGAGNGTTTFNLPDLRAKFPVGRHASNTRFDNLAETGGQESVSHTHVLDNGATVTNRSLRDSQGVCYQRWRCLITPHCQDNGHSTRCHPSPLHHPKFHNLRCRQLDLRIPG